jgi:hypothetical protein
MIEHQQLRLSLRPTTPVRFQRRFGKVPLALLLASLFLFAAYQPIAHAGPRPEGPDITTEAEQAMFTRGQTLYTQGLYGEAIVIFNEFLKRYPNSIIRDLSLLWLGRSYLREGDIANAERMGLRLREIPDTTFVGLFEEELRIARQSYVKSAAPFRSRRNDATSKVAPSLRLPDKPTISTLSARSDRSNASPVPSTVDKPKVPASSLGRPGAVVAGRQGDHARTSQSPSAAIPPAANRVLARPQKETKASRSATASATVVAPILRLRIEEMPRVAAANGVVFYRLIVVNEGNGAASDLIVQEELDGALDFASSDPAPVKQEIMARTLLLTFRLSSLGPGGSRSIRIAVRPRRDVTATTATQTKHSVTYRDSKGNSYHTP